VKFFVKNDQLVIENDVTLLIKTRTINRYGTKQNN
jgi:hypothetical protein